MKLAGSQWVSEGEGIKKKFFHPYMQTTLLFVAEALLYLGYLWKKKHQTTEQKEGKLPHNFTVFFIPAICMVGAYIFKFAAYNFLSPSTFGILGSPTIFIMMIFSKFMLKMQLKKYHYVGCCLTFVGLILVALSDFLFI